MGFGHKICYWKDCLLASSVRNNHEGFYFLLTLTAQPILELLRRAIQRDFASSDHINGCGTSSFGGAQTIPRAKSLRNARKARGIRWDGLVA